MDNRRLARTPSIVLRIADASCQVWSACSSAGTPRGRMQMAIGKLWSVTLDCADAQELADFWAEALDGKVAYTSDNFVGAETPGGVWVGAYRIAGYEPPQW